VVAICGLVLYLLSGSLPWLAFFIGLGLVAMLSLAAQMPRVAQRLGELMVAEEQAPRPQ